MDGAITIGRGAGARMLADQDWSQFCLVTVELVSSCTSAIYVRNRGIGQWDSHAEENFVVVFGGLTSGDHVPLRLDLRRIARLFDQEAIALLLGDSELITPFIQVVEKDAAYGRLTLLRTRLDRGDGRSVAARELPTRRG
jgi:hypothetical protein